MKTVLSFFLLFLLLSCKSKMPVRNEPEAPADTMQIFTVTPDNVMEADLYLLGDESINFNEVYRNNDSIMASRLTIEFIDIKLFERYQANAVSFWLEDTGGAIKADTVLTLKTRDSILKFVDDTTDSEMHRTFSYEGRLAVINKLVVLGTYYEDYGYMLIDMDTGLNTATYQAFPVISPDKKFIVSLSANIYSPQSADMSIDRIENGTIVPELNASFKNWMPQESFFGIDGYLYVSVNHPSQYWRPDGEVNNDHQYIRIKIL